MGAGGGGMAITGTGAVICPRQKGQGPLIPARAAGISSTPTHNPQRNLRGGAVGGETVFALAGIPFDCNVCSKGARSEPTRKQKIQLSAFG